MTVKVITYANANKPAARPVGKASVVTRRRWRPWFRSCRIAR
jgi:hypothetical protein